METKFTKGEWIGKKNGKWFSGNDDWSLENYDCDSFSHVEVGCGNKTVAIVPMKGWNDSELDANAHLIAAAPEMYEMLSELSKHNYFKEQLPFSYDKVLEVLAKARGEQ